MLLLLALGHLDWDPVDVVLLWRGLPGDGHRLALLPREAAPHRPVLATGANHVHPQKDAVGRAAPALAPAALAPYTALRRRRVLGNRRLGARVDEGQDHRDVVGAHLVLQPEAIRLGNDSAAGVERLGELADHVGHRLVGQKLPHAVRSDDEELVVGRELLAEELWLRRDADGLCDRVADGAREGAAGEGLARRPHARRVAAVVELVAQRHVPVLVVLHQALELIAAHDYSAGRLDALSLVLSVGRLVDRERVGYRALALGLTDDCARVSNVGDEDLVVVEIDGDGRGAAHAVVKALHVHLLVEVGEGLLVGTLEVVGILRHGEL
mmetsp:Transcript_59395/g.128807  ORF Transcript_59395/g.128807 Transcript_59395/m.128807 type:complete len:325 (+) Transcript_59395:2502-3476(+)